MGHLLPRCASLISVFLLTSARLSAQAPPACTYDECALRVRSSFWSASLVKGATGERVARLGLFAPKLALFEQRSDSAAMHYKAFRSRHNTGAALSLLGLGVAIVAVAAAPSNSDLAGGLLVASLPLAFVAGGFRSGAAERLSRAVWWHNRGLSP